MKKSGIVAALLGMLCIAGSSAAFAQKLYWTASGKFGPFPITGLIPTIPKEKHVTSPSPSACGSSIIRKVWSCSTPATT